MSPRPSRRLHPLLALMTVAAGGGMVFESCTTRVRDDVMVGVRSYFTNDFLLDLTCGLGGDQAIEGCSSDLPAQ